MKIGDKVLYKNEFAKILAEKWGFFLIETEYTFCQLWVSPKELKLI